MLRLVLQRVRFGQESKARAQASDAQMRASSAAGECGGHDDVVVLM
jgi:hypothetical protein